MATREGRGENRSDARDDGELMKLIIEELDDARDLYELAQQLLPHLPIRSFDELAKVNDGRPMRFRDATFDVESLRPHIPGVVFPIMDAAGLVERLGHIIRMTPPDLGVDLSTEAGMRRQMRRGGAIAPGLGLMSQRMATATTVAPGMQPMRQSERG